MSSLSKDGRWTDAPISSGLEIWQKLEGKGLENFILECQRIITTESVTVYNMTLAGADNEVCGRKVFSASQSQTKCSCLC